MRAGPFSRHLENTESGQQWKRPDLFPGTGSSKLSHAEREGDGERENVPCLEIDTQSGANDQPSHTLLSLGSATTAGSCITSVGILFKPPRPLTGAIFKGADPSHGCIYTEVHSEAFGL